MSQELNAGTRVRLELDGDQVQVKHREIGQIGTLPAVLAREFARQASSQPQTLSLIDSILPASEANICKLLVTRASESILSTQIVEYATNAFCAERAKC